MKKRIEIIYGLLIFGVALLLNVNTFAQVPDAIDYQAILRDNQGNIVDNKDVTLRFSIRKNSADGTIEYQEIHQSTTNKFGLITLNIGEGWPVIGSFDDIIWKEFSQYLQVELDRDNVGVYTDLGTTRMVSVPYALHAKTAEYVSGGVTESDPLFVASPANGITSNNITNWESAYGWGNHAGLYRPINYVTGWGEITSNPFSFTSATDNQLLKYNSISGKWENWTPNFISNYTETDSIWILASANYYTKSNMQTSGASQLHFNNITNKPTTVAGYGITDAMTTANAANGINSTNINNWNMAFSWGNHAGLYLPINYTPAWSEISANPFSFTSPTNNQLPKYNSISGKWENWSPNYLTSYNETDPAWTLASSNYYTKTNMQTSGSSQLHFNNLTNKPTTVAGYGITDAMTTANAASGITSANITNWNNAYNWGNHAGLYRPINYVPNWNEITNKPYTIAGYGITDAMSTSQAANVITGTNIANWNNAYNWGPHAGLYRPISYVPDWSEITSNPFSFFSVANNQLPKYNSVSGKWENWTPNYLTSYNETDPKWTGSAANATVDIYRQGKVGIGTTNLPNSQLEVNGSIANKIDEIPSASSLNDTHSIVIINGSTTMDVSVELPIASGCKGRIYTVIFDLTGKLGGKFDTHDSIIPGSFSIKRGKYNVCTLISDGESNWYVLSSYDI